MSPDSQGDLAMPTMPATAERESAVASTSTDKRLYPPATREMAEQRHRLAPGPAEAFRAFSRSVFAPGALPERTKQLIAVAVAHVTQCPYCIRSHTHAAVWHGASSQEIMEAIWVAAEMRAGGAYAHSALALDVMAHEHALSAPDAEVAGARETRSDADRERAG
jgi:AhpD family alkylhydroperoxidase